MDKKFRTVFFAGILVCMTVLLYAPTLVSGFFSDDWHWLFLTATQSSVWQYFTTNIIGTRNGSSYGPLLNLFFTMQYQVFGLHAFWYHLVNLLAHLGVVSLIYTLVAKMTGNKPIGYVAALLFTVLPAHSEAVVWVASETHVFGTLFFFLSIYAYYRFVTGKEKLWYGLAMLSIVLSLGIKEISITFLGVYLLIEFFYGRDKKGWFLWLWQVVQRFIVPLVLLLGYLWLRRYATGYVAGYYGQTHLTIDLAALRQMFIALTVNIFFTHPYRLQGANWFFQHEWLWWSLCLSVLGSIFATAKIYHRHLFFFVGAYVVVSLPFLTLLLNPSNDEGERYVYLLSVFAVSFVAVWWYALCARLLRGRTLFFVGTTILCLVFAIILRQKNHHWVVSGQVVTSILAHVTELHIEPTDYIYFVGLPDTVQGAQIFRNAIKEAIFLTSGTQVSGERIPLYTMPEAHDATRPLVIVSSTLANTYQFQAVDTVAPRIFTGFREWKTVFATFYLQQFLRDNTGTSIVATLSPDALATAEREGKRLRLIYFTDNRLREVLW